MNGFLVILPETAYAWKYMSAWFLRVYMAASESLCEKTRYTCTHLKKLNGNIKWLPFFLKLFYFAVIVESDAVVSNGLEISYAPFSQW